MFILISKFTCFYLLNVSTKFKLNVFSETACNILDVLWLVKHQPHHPYLLTPSVGCVPTSAREPRELTVVGLNVAGTVVSGNYHDL